MSAAIEQANRDVAEALGRSAIVVRAAALTDAERRELGFAPGDYAALSIEGETARAIVPRGAPAAEVRRLVAELHEHRDRADRAAAYWVDRCVEAYEQACDRRESAAWAVAR